MNRRFPMKATAQAATNLVDLVEEFTPSTTVKSAKKQRLYAVDPNQLGLFDSLESAADDILALDGALKAADVVETQTDDVLLENAELVAELETFGRDDLDFARFMRSANFSHSKVRNVLSSSTSDVDAVMEQLKTIEGGLSLDESSDDELPDEIGMPSSD